MGMFGVSLPPQQPTGPFSMMDPNAMSPAKPPTMTPQAQAMPQRTGMLGQLVGAFTGQNAGRNLRILGATLRQLGGGPQSNDLDSLLQQLQQQDQLRLQQNWQQTLQQRQQGEWNTEDKKSGRLADWVNTLPPDQRSEAMVDPARAYQSHVQAETTANMPLTPYQRDSLTEEHRHNVATENRPNGGLSGRPPPGYRWTPNGDLEAIPGGPAASRASQQQAKAARAALDQLSASQNVLNAIARARDYANRFGGAGIIGNTLQSVPGTNANLLHNELNTIQANIGFDKLSQMRANSPTGGALGNVSDRETALLQAVLGSLAQSQTGEQLVQHLDQLRDTYRASVARLRDAYDQDFGSTDVGAATTQSAPSPNAGPVRVNTPQDAQRLLPGTEYVTPDGRRFRR